MTQDNIITPAPAQAGLVVHWTHFKSVNCKTAMETAPIAWEQAAALLTNPQYRLVLVDKESAPLISFAQFNRTRSKKNTIAITAVVLDFDAGTALDTIRRALAGIDYVVYSTHNHTIETPKFRVIIPLSHPVTAVEYPAVWAAVDKMTGGTADQSAKDASRISYWPSCPQERIGIAFSDHHHGDILDPDALLADTPAAGVVNNSAFTAGINTGPPDMKQGVTQGARHKELLRRVGWCLGPDKMTEEETLAACLEWGKLCEPPLDKEEVYRAVTDIAEEERKKPKPLHPCGYSMKEDGLYWKQTDKDKPYSIRISGPFEVVAKTRDAKSEAWGILLRWQDPDGRPHEWAMPRSMLGGDATDVRVHLLHGGLHVEPGRTARERFTAYLSLVHPEKSVRCVDCTGWHGDIFVTPGKTYGPADAEPTLLQSIAPVAEFQTIGTLDGWKEHVAALAVGNSRLAFAIAAGFAGPLLYIQKDESGGFHLTGASSIGKTTALYSAASVWGCTVPSWRTTDNAAENMARAACDSLLAIDEIGQADPRVVDMLGYLFANGQGKQRMKRDGSARKAAQWRVLMLSTGEMGLAEKLAEVGKRAHAGQAVRLIEIPADAGAGHGMFENLHGEAGGAEFAKRVMKATKEHAGHAAPLFLDHLVADTGKARKQAETLKQLWIKQHQPNNADGQVSRAAHRFALVAAAGEMAIIYGILPWPKGEAMRAVTTCFNAWITRRGGIGSAEITEGIAQVRAFLEAHGASRFEGIGVNPQFGGIDLRIPNRAGFRKMNEAGFWEYHILPEIWRNEVCKGYDASAIAKAMKAQNALLTNSGRLDHTIRPPGHGTMKVYTIAASFLGCTDNQ